MMISNNTRKLCYRKDDRALYMSALKR